MFSSFTCCGAWQETLQLQGLQFVIEMNEEMKSVEQSSVTHLIDYQVLCLFSFLLE